MKLFENEKLKKVNERIAELASKREALDNEIRTILKAVEDSVQDYALGNVDEETVQKAEDLLRNKSFELKQIDEMLQRVKGVRNGVALETVPFVKEAKKKKVEAIQDEYNKQVKAVHEARNGFLEALSKLGQVKNKVGAANVEFNAILADLGESPSVYGSAINETIVISNGWTKSAEALGIEENVQKQVYSSGVVPNDFKGTK